MAKALKKIQLGAGTNLLGILEDVHMDKVPRLIERHGEPLAVVLSPDDYHAPGAVPKSKRLKRRLMALAGAWSDLDADRMIEELYKARHDAPPSPAPQL
ncbi:MAG: hypothetical protein HY675_19510 [Chloroflexi bacterium]|nr:hypothetical protein [Chloroflexota bacterium]